MWLRNLFLLSLAGIIVLYILVTSGNWYIWFALGALAVIGYILYRHFLLRSEVVSDGKQIIPMITEGQITVDGNPTKVVVLDNSFIQRVKEGEQQTQSVAVFKPLSPSKFRLLE